MIARRLIAVLALVALAGCSSSGGSPKTSAPPDTAGTSELVTRLQQGTADLTSTHIDVDAGLLGGTITGDLAIKDGATTAADVTVDQGDGPVEIVTVDGTSYAKLPAARNTSGKPWAKVSEDSSNEFVRGLAGTVEITAAATDVTGIVALVEQAAGNVSNKGSAIVAGAPTTHYAMTIDVAKAPAGPLADTLGQLGQKTIPIEVWLDKDGRPVQVVITVALGSQSMDLKVGLSKFNAPVEIAVPPADQVSSD